MNRDRNHAGRQLTKMGLVTAFALLLPTLAGCLSVPLPVLTPMPTPMKTTAASKPAPSTSNVPTTPSSSTPSRVTITSTALAGYDLGTDETAVIATLTELLGPPSRHNEGSSCMIFSDAPYASWYTFGPLHVSFMGADAQPSSPRGMDSFGLELASATDPRLDIAKDLPVTASFADLARMYPNGESFDGPGSPAASKFFQLPGGNVTFSGDYYADDPDYMLIGPLRMCE